MSERSDMDCAELADVAAELALGVLTGRERAMAVAHLERCEACREHVRQLTATGEQLVELLPPAEPPAGFESRVLARIGLPAPAQEGAQPSSTTRPRRLRLGSATRARRALAVAAVLVAVVGAGLAGWSMRGATSPAGTTGKPLASASLLSATHQDVGDIFLYQGPQRWLYMSVYLGSGDEQVTCQLISANGQVIPVGNFRLADGHGGWGADAPARAGDLRGARLVSANGTVLASATFAQW